VQSFMSLARVRLFALQRVCKFANGVDINTVCKFLNEWSSCRGEVTQSQLLVRCGTSTIHHGVTRVVCGPRGNNTGSVDEGRTCGEQHL
jgi:hypothetical protein